MRVSRLNRMRVFDAAGRLLGRLHEIEVKDGEIRRLVYGKEGFFERMTGRSAPTKRPWSDVVKIDHEGIHLVGDSTTRRD
jgi:sporulation protein YlmC with PRC-barrel domain